MHLLFPIIFLPPPLTLLAGPPHLQEAVKHTEYDRLRGSNNRPPGLVGIWPEAAVTFVDNHDTGSTQRHWPWPSEHVMLGYAYILTHPGIPCVFWGERSGCRGAATGGHTLRHTLPLLYLAWQQFKSCPGLWLHTGVAVDLGITVIHPRARVLLNPERASRSALLMLRALLLVLRHCRAHVRLGAQRQDLRAGEAG